MSSHNVLKFYRFFFGYLKNNYRSKSKKNIYTISYYSPVTFNKMTSAAPSDSESNVSGFIRYSEKDLKHLYTSMIQNMEIINADILEIERNMKNIIKVSGPFESQLSALLQTLPKQYPNLPMDIE